MVIFPQNLRRIARKPAALAARGEIPVRLHTEPGSGE